MLFLPLYWEEKIAICILKKEIVVDWSTFFFFIVFGGENNNELEML